MNGRRYGVFMGVAVNDSPLDVVQVTLLMVYGIYILRTWKTPDRAQVEAVVPRA